MGACGQNIKNGMGRFFIMTNHQKTGMQDSHPDAGATKKPSSNKFFIINKKMFAEDEEGTKKRIDDNGFLVAYDVPIAKTGIQFYKRSELGDTSGSPYDDVPVFRDPSAFDDSKVVESFDGNPITDNHPDEGYVHSGNYSAYAIGTLSQPYRKDDDLYAKKLTIFDKNAIERIWSKEAHQLSIGFKGEVSRKRGAYKGQRYEFEEHVLHGNHLALCEQGKAGARYAINSIKEIQGEDMKRNLKNSEEKHLEDSYHDDDSMNNSDSVMENSGHRMGGDQPHHDIGPIVHKTSAAHKAATSHKQMHNEGKVEEGISREKQAVKHLEKEHMMGDSDIDESEHKDKDLINSYETRIAKLTNSLKRKDSEIADLRVRLSEREGDLEDSMQLNKELEQKLLSRHLGNAMSCPDRKSPMHHANADFNNTIAQAFNCMTSGFVKK